MFLVFMLLETLLLFDRLLYACFVYTHEYIGTEQVSGSGSWHDTACRMLPVTFKAHMSTHKSWANTCLCVMACGVRVVNMCMLALQG